MQAGWDEHLTYQSCRDGESGERVGSSKVLHRFGFRVIFSVQTIRLRSNTLFVCSNDSAELFEHLLSFKHVVSHWF